MLAYILKSDYWFRYFRDIVKETECQVVLNIHLLKADFFERKEILGRELTSIKMELDQSVNDIYARNACHSLGLDSLFQEVSSKSVFPHVSFGPLNH